MDPTAAPVDLKLGDKTYTAHPLRDIDHERMNKWVRKEYMERVKGSISGDLDLQRVALSNVVNMDWMSGDGLRVAMTVDGLHKLAVILCRGQRLELEPAALESEDLERIYAAYKEAHTLDAGEAEAGNGEDGSPK